MAATEPDARHSAARLAELEAAAAQRDALLDVVAVLAHDLSNPLQSVTVLCELGVDDSAEGSEDRTRFEQMLQAADRMRGLVHGFAGLARNRGGRSTLTDVVDRAVLLLQRRFERHRMEVSRRLAIGGHANVPPQFEFCLLNALLGIVLAADQAHHPRHTLSLVTGADDGALFVAIECLAYPPEGEPIAVSIPDRFLARCYDAAQGMIKVLTTSVGLRLELGSFSP